MDPIVRRSSFYYAGILIAYTGLLGRYMLTRDWAVFEAVPLFWPIFLISGMAASEAGECYAFLRMLPVPDRTVVMTKFALMLSAVAPVWVLMTAVALARLDDGFAGPSTLVYITVACMSGLLLAACCQIAIWRFGKSRMFPVIGVGVAGGLVACIFHLAGLAYEKDWPAVSRLDAVEWLGGAPWIASAVIAALSLLVFAALMRVGVHVKAASEAHL